MSLVSFLLDRLFFHIVFIKFFVILFLDASKLFVVVIREALYLCGSHGSASILLQHIVYHFWLEHIWWGIVNLNFVELWVFDDDENFKCAEAPQLNTFLKHVLSSLTLDIVSVLLLLNVLWQFQLLHGHQNVYCFYNDNNNFYDSFKHY